MTPVFSYPGFKYSASELLSYITILNDFTIILQNGDIVQYLPDNHNDFKEWLDGNNIQNIREEKGWIVE